MGAASGRHRPSAGTLRVTADADGGWVLTPHRARPSSHIGRVGALAVALGVGGMIGLPGIASADPVDGPDPGGSAATGPARPTAAPVARKPHRAAPRNVSGAETAASPRNGSASSALPARRRNQQPVNVVDVGDAARPPTSTPSASPSVPVSDPAAPAAAPDNVGSAPPESAASTEVLSGAAATVEATAPAMTVSPASGQLSGADPAVILGGGGDPTAPLAVPLGWAGVAASRRRAWGALPLAAANVSTVETVTAPAVGEAATVPDVPRAAAVASSSGFDWIGSFIDIFGARSSINNAIVGAIITSVEASVPALKIVHDELVSVLSAALTASNLDAVLEDDASPAVIELPFKATFEWLPQLADPNFDFLRAFTSWVGGKTKDWLPGLTPRITEFLQRAIDGVIGDADIRGSLVNYGLAALTGNQQLYNLLQPAVSAAADAVAGIVPPIASSIGSLVGTFLRGNAVPSEPVVNQLGQAVNDILYSILLAGSDPAGLDTETVLADLLKPNSSVEAALSTLPTSVGQEVTGLLTGPAYRQALAFIPKLFIDTLLGTSAGQAGTAQLITNAITSGLGSPLGPLLSAPLNTAITAVLNSTSGSGGLGTAVSTTIVNFLGSSQVPQTINAEIVKVGNQLLAGGAINPTALIADLLNSDAIQGGLVSGLVSGFNPVLGDIAGAFVSALGSEPAQRTAVAGVVTDLINSALGTQTGGVLAAPVSTFVDNLLLISSYLPFASGGLGNAIATTVDNLLSNAVLTAPLKSAIKNVGDQLLTSALDPTALIANLIGDSSVQQALGSAVVAGIGSWLSDATVVAGLADSFSQLVTTLVGDSSARDLIKTAVVQQVTVLLGAGPGAAAVSGILGDAAVGFLAGTGIDSALGNTVGAAFSSLIPGITASGVLSPLITTALQFATAVLNGTPQADAVSAALTSLMGQSGFTSALGSTVSAVLNTLLSDPAFASTIGSTATLVLNQLAATPLALGFLGGDLTGLLSSLLPDGLGTSTVPATLTAAVIGLLADADRNGLSDAVGSALSTLLAAPGIATAISGTAVQFISAVLGGADISAAGAAVIPSLTGNADFTAGIGATINALLLPLLSGSIFRRDVETALTTAIPPIFGDTAVRTLLGGTVAGLIPVGGEVGAALNPAVGSLVANLLASPAIVGALTSGLGPALEGFLGAPGMAALLTSAVNDFVTQAFSGASITDALSGVIASLSANPNFVSGSGQLVTAVLGSVLNGPGVTAALGSSAAALVTQVVGNPLLGAGVAQQIESLVIGQLGDVIGAAIGGAAGETLMGLLSNPVLGTRLASSANDAVVALLSFPGFGELITMVAGGLTTSALGGQQLSEVLASTLTALGAEPMFTGAVRAAVTALVGPILGDQRVIGALGSSVASLVMTLIDDPRVAPWVGDQIESVIANMVGGDIGAVLGGDVSDTVMGLLTNPVLGARLVSSIDALVVSLLSFPGFGDLITGVAGGVTTAVLQGQALSAILPSVLASLGADGTFTGAISSALSAFLSPLLGDAGVVNALGSSIASLVMQVLGDPLVVPWVGQQLDSLVAVQVGGDLGQLLGSSISEIIVNLLSDPDLTAKIVSSLDNAVTTLLGAQGFGALIGTAGGDLAGGALEGQPLVGDLFGVLASLNGNPMFEMTVNSTLAALLVPLLSDPELGDNLGASLMMVVPTLLGDPSLRMMIGTVVAGFIPGWIGGQIGAALANPVGDLVQNLLADTALINPLAMGLGPAVAGFLGMPGVADLLNRAVNRAADAALSGIPITDALTGVLNALRADPAFDAEVGDLISAVVGPVLTDPAVAPSLGPSISTLVMQILDDPAIQGLVGDGIKTLLAAQLPGGAGTALGTALSTAVVGLLADPGLSSQLGSAIGPALDALLGTTGVMPLIAGLAGQIVSEVLPDYSFMNTVQVVIRLLPGLAASPTFDLALGNTVTAALSSLIGPALVPGAESFLSTVLAGVADPGVVQWIGTQLDSGLATALGGDLGRVLGPVAGGAVTSLLSDPGFNAGLVDSLNSAVNTLLSYPGLGGLLGVWAGPLVTQLLEGAPPVATVIAALDQLRSAPVFIGTLNATVPALLESLLGSAGARAGLGRSAGAAVAIALDQIGLAVPVLQVAAAQAANAALTSLLAAPPIWELAGTAIIDLVEGSSINDVVTNLFDSVISQSRLQDILGTAVGMGVGAVFGDNPVGQLIATVATGATTIALSVLSGIARLATGVPSQPDARTAVIDSGRYFQIDFVTGRLVRGGV